MNQEDVAGKQLLELLEMEIINEKDEEEVYVRLKQVYAAGYDEGRLQPSHRKSVGQYTLEGKLIKIWESSTCAARFFKVEKSAVSRAALGKSETCSGFRWKYINHTKPISETETETIGSSPPKSTPRK